ncbi:Endonuclease I [Mesobacillus persicus]|uniref:Endonuclease I n=1 Tax=Mesobacillus persicus TaxID=930146 RepID=A0A1H8JAP2_9BACI|nr:endonuclease [Mesobacillus persicus]SEN77729.1 Endonuclease I [Mesobacillus persicus]
MGKQKKPKKDTKKKKIKMVGHKPLERIDLKKQLAFLKANKRRIQQNQELYYNEQQNQCDLNHYYGSIFEESTNLSSSLTKLLMKSHKNQVPYFISKDLYLYTWVDLYPDGTVKSIYSGEEKDPASLIVNDQEIIRIKYEEFLKYFHEVGQDEYVSLKKLKSIDWKFRFNTEHIVPQSWFGALEPMKGDLHHLFTCQPDCNISRSNFPYADFTFYTPESVYEPIQNHCGVAINEKFEPEHGKGKSARAMLYFLLRYPDAIKRSFRNSIDLPLLKRWNQQFPVTLYEKHRNQSIYMIQGNRNPFIDFPDLAEEISFL